jgi:uncharacterized coiled-coil DUF342 family protein
MAATGNVSLGTFDSTMELRRFYQQSTQNRPPQGRTNNNQPTCQPQKLPTTLKEAQDVRDALKRQSDELDNRIAQYNQDPTHSPKELDELAARNRCMTEQFKDLLGAVKRLKEQARARSDAGSARELEKVDDDLFNLTTKELGRLPRLDAMKTQCRNLPQPSTVDKAESYLSGPRVYLDNLTTSIDRYLANPTREQRNSIVKAIECQRNLLRDIYAKLDGFDRKASASGDTRTRSKVYQLKGELDGLWRDTQAQEDRLRR